MFNPFRKGTTEETERALLCHRIYVLWPCSVWPMAYGLQPGVINIPPLIQSTNYY